jgi:hypothetical protein
MSLEERVTANRQILHYIEEQAETLTPARKERLLRGAEQYVDLLREGRHTEVLADLINLTSRSEFAKAAALLLGSAAIMTAMTDYIEKVKM